MKKLSKIVALLLAGALTMLLFTACGGGGGGSSSMSEDKDAETKVMGLIQKRKVPQACRMIATCRRSLQPSWTRTSRAPLMFWAINSRVMSMWKVKTSSI